MHLPIVFLVIVSSAVVFAQRPVYPLIPLYGPSPFKPSQPKPSVDERYTANDMPMLRYPPKTDGSYAANTTPQPTYAPPPSASQVRYQATQNDAPAPPGQVPPQGGKGQFVESDGVRTSCSNNADCYEYREPQKWCRLASDTFWIEKGCYCERSEGACIIQRKSPQELQWTWCAPKNNWVCNSPYLR